ncbi:MAG: DUF72 domain-containing protein [Chloroflexi bacterium]|nr:DUF72 domain-containing protein [Chloroflexota bacterium]
MIYLGTSGFSYEDWVGPYYPEGLEKKDWLAFYGKEFNTLEINFSYYRMPAPRTLAQMASKVPANFLFTIKATQEMTHTREADPALFPKFVTAVQPLLQAGKFGAVLAQFPASFHHTPENVDYLKAFRQQLLDLPVVVEFRNAQWLNEQTFQFLQEQQLGFCCVDEPRLKGLLPPVARATSDVAYVRFHGRNAMKWWQHEQAYERYDYTYSQQELQEWTPKIENLNAEADKTFVFANNHYRGQGIDTARQLRSMLQEQGADVSVPSGGQSSPSLF